MRLSPSEGATKSPLNDTGRKMANVETLIDNLLSILHQEIALYQELYRLLHDERRVMTELSLEGLYISNNRKETLLLRLKVLERARLDLIDKIAPLIDLKHGEVTITTLISSVSDPGKGNLLSCYTRLSSLVESIEEINYVNGLLIEKSLSYIKGSISYLNSLISPLPIYMPTGLMRGEEKSGKILSRRG